MTNHHAKLGDKALIEIHGLQFEGANGIAAPSAGVGYHCATLVASWLSMRAEGTMVTKLDQFPNNFALSIAQSSYEVGGSRESLLDVYGLSMLTKHSAKRKWYMFKKTRVAEAVNAAAGWPGFFYLRITGDGGHALGIVSKGTPQFLDPNEGILTFASLKDMSAWTSAYVPDAYPDLVEEVGL